MSKHAVIRPMTHADERREALVKAAYQCIAEQGLKGLRTRDVAAQVGITHATLHYYFASKEDLIRAVVEFAVFQQLLDSVPRYEGSTPIEGLDTFIGSLQSRMKQSPTDFLVLFELVRHAQSDPAIRKAFTRQEVFGDWHTHLKSLVEQGISQGQFRADLDPTATASLLMVLILGLGMTLLVPVPSSEEALRNQLVRLLTG